MTKKRLSTDELRQKFLNFFSSKGHKIYPSDSLVPKEDLTLLFTSAGMNQFKQEFLGKPTQFRRRVTCQKCLRTDDLDKVGKTNAHHTFFEMLGNFSFGDYFKEEAISWGWEFVTRELNLPEERLMVSVYQDDQEAFKIWQEKVGLPEERIVKLGATENFWPANAPEEGPNGPCGPCSEIFYDYGEGFGCAGPDCTPACGCERFVEVWNLVFTQFDRQDRNVLEPLPNKNIDTGMGLERMAAVLQGRTNNFDIDIFQPITAQIIGFSTLENGKLNPAQFSARNAIADHIRAVTFAVADGVVPSNDERGYVIRKLIRRAIWHGKTLGIEKPYLYKIVPAVVKVMKSAYPDLEKKRENIAQVVLAEERRFQKSLQRAVSFGEGIFNQLKKQGKHQVPGSVAFKLYDTYGLPQEMLEALVKSKGLTLDKQGFLQELELQRKSSRKASIMEEAVFVSTLASKFKLKPTKFLGDSVGKVETRVCALFKDDQSIRQARAKEQVKIILESTPFYGEAGGQVGDIGIIKNQNLKIEVLDAHKVDQTVVHLGKVVKGTVQADDWVTAEIDLERRKQIANNHTATHLLQSALRKVLGEHVRQAGSRVGPDKLRFDFTHFHALSKRELSRVEELVNNEIKQDRVLDVSHMDFAESQNRGALAFFGEKYQDKVRVVKIGDVSLELCGGTHVSSTGQIGIFKIISESSVASGIRRIEAVTGEKARDLLFRQKTELDKLAQDLGAKVEELPERMEQLQDKIKGLDKKLDKSRLNSFKSRIEQMVNRAREVAEVKVISEEIKSADMKILRLMADLLKQKVLSCVIVLVSVWERKVAMVCALSSNVQTRGLNAAKIIRLLAADVDGSGGGRADFAQAGGRKPEGIKKVLSSVGEVVKKELKR